eukprot:31369-Pelagococcus_subviridis.AAC.2
MSASRPKITPGAPGASPNPAWNAASSPTRTPSQNTSTPSAPPPVTFSRTPAPSTRSRRSGVPPAPMTITPRSCIARSRPFLIAFTSPENGFIPPPSPSLSPLSPLSPPTMTPALSAAALFMIVCGAPVSTSAGMDTPFTVTPTASSPHGSSFSANDSKPPSGSFRRSKRRRGGVERRQKRS